MAEMHPSGHGDHSESFPDRFGTQGLNTQALGLHGEVTAAPGIGTIVDPEHDDIADIQNAWDRAGYRHQVRERSNGDERSYQEQVLDDLHSEMQLAYQELVAAGTDAEVARQMVIDQYI